MKNRIIIFFALVMLIFSSLDSFAGGRHSGGHSHPYYGGGHHTYSHGGYYRGGHGSSHKGGHYRNSRTNNTYGRHRR